MSNSTPPRTQGPSWKDKGEASAAVANPRPRKGPAPMLSQGEHAQDFKGTLRKLIAYLGHYKFRLVAAIVAAIASVVFNVIGPSILGQATNVVFEGVMGEGGIDFARIGGILAGLLIIYLASAGAMALQNWLMTGITQDLVYRLRGEIAEKISRVPLSYFDGKDASKGDVLSRMTNDVDTLSQSLNQGVTQLITSTVQVIGVAVMMFSISVPLAAITFITLPVSVAIIAAMMHFSQPLFRAQQKQLGRVNARIEEDFSGQTVIQAFAQDKRAIADFERENDALYDSAWKSQFIAGLVPPFMNMVGNLGYVAVVVAGVAFAAAGAIQPGDIQAFIQYVRNFTQPIRQLANVSNVLQQMAACAERVFEFLDAPEELEGAGENHSSKGEPAVETASASATEPALERIGKAQGRISFDHVSFGYLPGKPIIRDFTFETQPGQTVAIVGPTGAGKTTLMKLLMRFYDVDAGAIRVDGHDVRNVARADLRGNVSMVLQDAWLFKGPIRENIRFGRPDATDEEVEAACERAYCAHFISTLPGGYDFELNEGATNVSQGQRQLLTIARAVLANRPILVLDEATSNVDTRTEWRIQRSMDALMEGRTSFVIAHRLSTVRNADAILVIGEGGIEEEGNHEDLLARGGAYAKLYESQFDQTGAE